MVLVWAVTSALMAPVAASSATAREPEAPIGYLSVEAQAAETQRIERPRPVLAPAPAGEAMRWLRARFDREVFEPNLALLRRRYAVHVQSAAIAGVPVEIVTPAEGVPPENAGRVLIALHSGAFLVGGGGAAGVGLAVPVAALGRVEVISVDYRLAPEHRYPAAVDDVIAVYRTLLRTHPANRVGLYGCSAGGLLVAQTLARAQTIGLPSPGAIGLLCVGGEAAAATPANGARPAPATANAVRDVYGAGVDPADPLFAPLRAPAVLARFPPTLIITSTGAAEMGGAMRLDVILTNLGVRSALHVWEGLPHAFFDPYGDPDTPEARQAQAMIAGFFERELKR